jgi:hypothetical protein
VPAIPTRARTFFPPAPRSMSVALALAVGFVGGCGSKEPVVSYRVPTEQAIYEANHVDQPAPEPETLAGPERLIAALLPQPNATYIFKVKHAKVDVDPLADEIHALLANLDVGTLGAPTWKLPDGWEEQPNENGFGGYRIIHAGKSRVPIAVSKLSPGQDVLSNVNRWMDQVGLPNLTADQLDSAHGVDRVDVDGTEMLVVDVVGTPPGGSGGAPFANMGGGGASPHGNLPPAVSPHGGSPHGGGAVPSAVPQNPTKFAYITPEGWSPTPATGIRLLSFAVANGDGEPGEVRLFRLTGNPQFLFDTLNQWRGELKLEPLQAGADLAEFARPITMNVTAESPGIEGAFVDLSAAGDASDRDALLGAIFVTSDNSWVVKFKGSRDLLDREREHFRTFVESLRILPTGADVAPPETVEPGKREPNEPQPTEPKPDDEKPDGPRSTDTKPDGVKSDEPKPSDNEPAATKPDAPQPGTDDRPNTEPQPAPSADADSSDDPAGDTRDDNGDTPAKDDQDVE